MPLARIRTTLSSVTKELKQQLHAAGYDVELVKPGKKCSGRADLEITFDAHPADQVLAATRPAVSELTSVYVATGVFDRLASEQAERLQQEQAARLRSRAEDQRRRAEEEILRQRRDEQQRIEQERLRREEIEAERHDRVEQQRQRQELAARLLAEQERVERERAAKLQVERDRVDAERREQERVLQMWREAEARQEQRAAELKMQQHAEEPDPSGPKLEADQRSQAELRMQAEIAEQEREARGREEQARLLEERRRLRADQAKLREEEERLRLDIQHKQEELQSEQHRLRLERERFERDRLMAQQAAELPRIETADPSAIIVPTEANSPTENSQPTIVRTSLPQEEPGVVRPLVTAGHFVEHRRHPRFPFIKSGARRFRHKEYRRAAVAAAVLTFVVMGLWIALSSRRPASPLATSQLVQTAGMEQGFPFGAAKLSSPVPIQSVQQHPQGQPNAPQSLNTQAEKPVPQSARQSTARKPSPAKKQRVARRASANDGEVVVRHFGTGTAATAKKTASNKDGVKVFSDMN